ncbi:MAG: carboxypeptidase-like regulatory domain-containing protein, partial [Candidatus Sulfotelmatobacter sp.]
MSRRIHHHGPMILPDATRLQLVLGFRRIVGVLLGCVLKVLRNFQKITLRPSLVLCLLGTAWAGVGGSISGTIKDPSGAAIAKATVTLMNLNTDVSQTTIADGRGAYTFPVLPVGDYVLEVNQPGFQ